MATTVFERTGSLAVAVEDYQLQALKDADEGDSEVFFDEAGIRGMVNSPTYLGGLWSE